MSVTHILLVLVDLPLCLWCFYLAIRGTLPSHTGYEMTAEMWGVWITGDAYPKGAWLEAGSGRWAASRDEAESEAARRREYHTNDTRKIQFEARPHSPPPDATKSCPNCGSPPDKKDHHYSGDNSVEFWGRVGALKDEGDHAAMYSLGCALQNLENYVMQQLAQAEKQ